MFQFFSKKQESVSAAQIVEILTDDRKQQAETISQNIEKVVAPICELINKQQETLADDRKQQAETISQNIEKVVAPICELINKQQEVLFAVTQSAERREQALCEKLSSLQAVSWQDYENAHGNALIRLEEYKKQEELSQQKAARANIEAQQLKAAYALNMCMVSLSQIVDYNDINILKLEYEAILNNLNFENIIKDEALLDALKKILDTCHFYILHEKDKEMQKKKQAARLKGLLGKALGGRQIIAVFGTPNPWAMVAGAAVLIGSAVVSYKSEKSKAQMENEAEEWELEKSALEQLHNLRRTLFETTWRLAKTYEFPDKFRLTEKLIHIYNDALADSDPLNRYERLSLLEENFEAYPLFWYYLGRSALETADLYRPLRDDEWEYRDNPRPANMNIYQAYRKKAKDALDKFIELHAPNQLLREDVIAASAYIDAADFYLTNPDRMKECIDNAKKIAGVDLEILQNCAFRYGQMIEMFQSNNNPNMANECRKSAIYCLRLLLNEGYNPNLNGRALSQVYISQKDSGAYLILKDCIAQKSPFIYQYLLPWDKQTYQEDLIEYFKNGQLYNTAGQYFEGRIRCIFSDFYQPVYESVRNENMAPLEKFSSSVLKIENRSDWLTSKKENVFLAETKGIPEIIADILDYKNEEILEIYTDTLEELSKNAKTYERRWYTAGIIKHNINFSKSEFDEIFDKLESALKNIVYDQTGQFVENLKELLFANDSPSFDSMVIRSNKGSITLLDLIQFMTEESWKMQNEIQKFSLKKFRYNNYKPASSNRLL